MESDKDAEPLPLEAQNRALWRVWERSGVLSTSMESAAIFVVSSIRGVRAGEVLAVIGLTYEDAPIVAGVGIEEAIRVAIEAIKIMSNSSPGENI